jgi:HD superfamily phosphohydrolase
MILEVKRRIRDNLHGSLDITPLEDKVVAHPYFQRLRRIKQTAFLSMVFPGATHTRFEHSLGTMHLASKAWNKITSNQKRIENQKANSCTGSNVHPLSATFYSLDKIASSKYLLQVLRLAALLHDVGHPPLSHTGEIFLPNYQGLLSQNKHIPEFLRVHLNKNKKVSHEIMSLLSIDEILRDVYQDNDVESFINIASQDIAAILVPEIYPIEDSELSQLNLQKLFHELVSGEVDVDRMDYLLRDSKECGVAYGIFDSDRILDSLTYYLSPNDSCYHLAIKLSGLSAFEDYLRARQSMYLQLYFHKTSIACEAMLKYIARFIPKFYLPANLEKYMMTDDFQLVMSLQENIDHLDINDVQKEKISTTLKDLFFDRNLWKCIYETSNLSSMISTQSTTKNIEDKLSNQNKDYVSFTVSNNLCNSGENFLRLVRKNEEQAYEVVALDHFSKIYADNSTIKITRLYQACHTNCCLQEMA